MIPRYQLITFRILALGCLIMALLLLRGCVVTHERIVSQRDLSPIPAPTDIPDETISVALANDADGSITLDQESMALPQAAPLRARAILQHTLDHYALSNSLHPLPAGPAILNVYFVTLPLRAPSISSEASAAASDTQPAGELAVIDLKGAFVDALPSGIESEDLTLRSLIGTLHANASEITQVLFLVDGKPRDTLAGHADILHPYPAIDVTRTPLHTLSRTGTPE